MARDTNGTQQVIVRFSTELHEEIKRVAADLDLSMAQAIRAAVRSWVKAPTLEEVRPASNRGPCTCHQFTQGIGDTTWTLNPSCPQHAAAVG